MILLALLTTVVVLIDVTWQPLFLLRGVTPDWVLIWVVCLAILSPRKSLGIAFCAGFFHDILVSEFWGTRALSLLIIAGLVVFLKDRLFQYRSLTWTVLLTLSAILYPCLLSWSLRELGFNFLRLIYNLIVFALCMLVLSKLRLDDYPEPH